MNGVLVVGHGSRSKEAQEVFNRVVEGLKNKEENRVEGCFMELCEPNIPETVDSMYKDGVRDIVVVPYFLFSGIHIKEDIPEILRDVKEKYEDLNISMAKPIGYNEILVDILKSNIEGELVCI